jgi:predicted nuclease of restriction endonuclease-like (RecB) superfamily
MTLKDEGGKMKEEHRISQPAVGDLFERVVVILDQARSNVARSVNTNMVLAYWLIGREIVLDLQGGDERAEYGKQVLAELSKRLTERFKKGFSVTNLRYFRLFFQAFSDRLPIHHTAGDDSGECTNIDLLSSATNLKSIHHPSGDVLVTGFSPSLSWSHYRTLVSVENREARDFYENEAAECGWTKAQLERQIQSSYFQRIVANRGKAGLISKDRERLPGEPNPAEAILKTPYVLEFLGLSDTPTLHESDLEQAIIDNLQSFLLELGKGFCFVARQKLIRFDEDDFYIDLVFYNYILKCFLLIDLKIGKLTHRDVGQVDGYVRTFEDQFKVVGDNPTIGLILCSDKSEAVAKYSILSEAKQVFASKYLPFLPTEEELKLELQRERRMIEATVEENKLEREIKRIEINKHDAANDGES